MDTMNPTFAWAGDVSADIYLKCQSLIRRYSGRDHETAIMRQIRRGNFEAVSPGSFSDDFPAPIIANRIDTMARDMAAVLTPLPTISCPPSSTLRDNAKKFADRRTKIAHHYVESSFLQAQMPDGADSYHCYGMFVAEVRPDFSCKSPKIKVLDGGYAYPVWDSDLNVSEILVVTFVSQQQLAAYYPGVAQKVIDDYPAAIQQDYIRVWRYQNAKETLVFLPDAKNLLLERVANKLGKCTFVAIPRPMGEDWFAVPRGAFADLVYPQIAANDLRMLALEATEKSVRAPIVVPTDVNDVSFGPDATIRTQNPAGVQKLKMDVPPTAFQSSAIIDQDIQVGGMSPTSRTGQVNASVITGRGVDALGEGYSQQVALAQSRLAIGIRQALMLCFEMDEKYWPNVTKEIRGMSLESPEKITYTPSKDINGDYYVTVDYGFLLGLDPNRALVFILQAQAAGLISNDTAARNLPIQLNLVEENNRIQLEQLRNSLLQAISTSSQALAQVVANGGQPGDLITQIAAVIDGVKKGDNIESVVAKVFAPPPPPPEAPALPAGPGSSPDAQGALAALMGGGGPQAMNPNTGAPDQNGRPSLQDFMAGLGSSGKPNLTAGVRRRNPVFGQ